MNNNNTLVRQSVRRKATKGFTLVEIMLVVAIGMTILGLGLYYAPSYLRTNRVLSVTGCADALRSGAINYISKPGALGTLPLTEGTIPASLFNGTGATSTNVAAAASLEQVLTAEQLLAKVPLIKMGPTGQVLAGTGVIWDSANNRWSCAAAPTMDKSATARTEVIMSSPGTPPHSANGANFMLDGTNNLPANVRVAYLVIPGVPAADAYELALTVDGKTMLPANNGLAKDTGMVVYDVPDAAGLTTVYFYLTHS